MPKPKPFERITDREFDAVADRVDRIYARAEDEIAKRLKRFRRAFAALDAAKRALLEAGKITRQQYQAWLMSEVYSGPGWVKEAAEITGILVRADRQAAAAIEGGCRACFAENANFAAYEIERGLRGAVTFNLYDQKTVNRLLLDNPKMLPEWKIDEPKDYTWNQRRVQTAVAQGIAKGESVAQIAGRLSEGLATGNDRKMQMFARTATNGAQNAGRQQRMDEISGELEEAGIEMKKRWDAVLDSRTRDAHQELDGKTVAPDESFHNSLGLIRYPGDPSADPANVYNCRCSISYVYPKYMPTRNRIAYRDETDAKGNPRRVSYMAGDITYEEWKKQKEAEARGNR